jgi:hypothetical protein
MRKWARHLLWWAGTLIAAGLLHFFFTQIVGMPLATLITLSLIVTWLLPHPWWALGLLSIVGEVLSITPPLVLAAALWTPLLIFWLRGRTEADLSFSFAALMALSAALALGLVVGITAYPVWTALPWPTLLFAWLSISVLAGGLSLILPSLQSRLVHDRYR